MGRRNISVAYRERNLSMWTKPAFTDLRIGFEVTMYFANR